MVPASRFVSAFVCFAFSATLIGASPPSRKSMAASAPQNRHAAYTLALPDGRTIEVFRGGAVTVHSKDPHQLAETRVIPMAAGAGVPDQQQVLREVLRPHQPYVQGRVVVVFRSGVSAPDSFTVGAKQLHSMRVAQARHQFFATPQYTNDAATNQTLAKVGTDSVERLFATLQRGALSAMRSRAATTFRNSRLLDIGNAYRLHVTDASARHALAMLKKLPSVAYASLDWAVTTMDTGPMPLSQPELVRMNAAASVPRRPMSTMQSSTVLPALPSNYALLSSEQSLLNASNTNWVAAYDEIERTFHQLPGQGEIITNVSLGDLDDASALNDNSNPCLGAVSTFGPTTIVSAGQRYIDWPSMPLIATYTADRGAHLNGVGQVCLVDPALGEVGLDFSMMAPLPHSAQRSSNPGSGATDLLGIAPGATYRLVVPASFNPDFTDIDAALLAAGHQTPHPDVITASLGLGVDVYGFPGRFLEDDPLSQSVIASIVSQFDTVVCVSANDGTRIFTTAAIGPSGGSAATNLASASAPATDISDIAFSTAPSFDDDSGSIAVGGTTLDDVFAAQPLNPQNSALASQHAFAETRYDGFTDFSSGYGTRVNVAAPADNVVAMFHPPGYNNPSIAHVGLEGGTSASAPEVAAAAAVVRQVARLTGQPMTALQVRDFLAKTGDPIPALPQSDVQLTMGTDLNLGHAVETLLAQAGKKLAPSVPRVAIEQRRRIGPDTLSSLLDGAFVTDTNPAAIDLQGPLSAVDATQTGANQEAWITIAPDWESVPSNTTFQLYVSGHPAQVLATTPYARLLPSQILQAAGLPLASSSSRTVSLTYVARPGGSVTHTRTRSILAGSRMLSTQFSITFGPATTTRRDALAPIVPPVVTNTTIPVTYDITNVRDVSNPTLVVSEPGRASAASGVFFHPSLSIPLTAPKGTINIPVASLQGGGIYGIGINYGMLSTFDGIATQRFPLYSDFAFTRVQPTAGDVQPSAPLLSTSSGTPGHFLEIPYGGSFSVTYDVSNVPNATGAMLEISSGGFTPTGSLNTFNNPNGTVRDGNGVDTGSVYYAPLSGTRGQVTLNGGTVGLIPALSQNVRIIPMSGSAAAGEASTVSTMIMDGIAPTDGGFLNLGYGVDQNGTNGFMTSNQLTAGGQVITSIQNFDQTTNTNTGGLLSTDNFSGNVNLTYGWGVWGNDIGLTANAPNSTGLPSYNILWNLTTGFPTGLWTPQIPTGMPSLQIYGAAANGATTRAAFWGQMVCGPFGPCGDFELFSSDLSQNSTGPIYDIQGAVQSFSVPQIFGIAQNHSTNAAVLAASDALNGAKPPTLVSVNLSSGQISSFQTLGGDNTLASLALDSNSNKAFTSIEDSSFGIYNLATQTGTRFMLPIGTERVYASGVYNSGYNAVADELHGYFAVAQVFAPDLFSNNNALSRIYVYDENGTLLKTISGFALYTVEAGIGSGPSSAFLQLNPSRRQGYVFGPFAGQLVPFTY